ncbi:MAG: T9SS type A sorting domain-containing protein [bacterium]
MHRTILLIALLLASFATAFSEDISVRVETDFAAPGETIYIRVLLETDTPLASLRVPITMESPWLTLDAVSWSNSVASPAVFFDTTNLADNNRTDWINVLIRRYETPFPTIDPPGGEICRFWITVDPEAPNGFIPIGTWSDQYTWVDASDELGNTFLPDFVAGGIWVDDGATGVEDDQAALPSDFSLGQNRPNPFNPTTTISFSLPQASDIELAIYDLLGRQVAILAQGGYPAGKHHVEWNAVDYPSGVYFYRLRAAESVLTRKMVLLK